MWRAYKYRLYPTREQADNLQRSLDLLRELYNAAIQERRDAWRLNRKSISCFDQIRQVPEIRASRPEFMNVQARVMQQTLRQTDKAFRAFYRRCKLGEKPGFPRFKNIAVFNSFFYSGEGFKLLSTRSIRLANIGVVKMRGGQDISGMIKQVNIKREGRKWFASLVCDHVPKQPLPVTGKIIGVDVGIESFATLSDGTHIANSRHFEQRLKEVRIANRRLSRRKKGSNGKRKALAALREIHTRIRNQRADFQHKLSTHLIQTNDLIAVEDLNIKGLARMRLAKQVLDASWASFIHKLTYKAESAGRKLVKVDPRGTSQTCTCGAEVRKALSVRWHNCSSCGLSQHRDIVSAQIILSRGLRDQTLTLPVTACVV